MILEKKKNKNIILLLIVFAALLGAVSIFLTATGKETEKPITKLGDLDKIAVGIKNIVYEEKVPDFERPEISTSTLPEELDKRDSYSVDFRHCDLSAVDLKNYDLLEYATFDTDTIWPDTLPENYNPEEILELGKNPGLGIEEIHEEGINGRGVNIAIIDSSILLNHKEYKDKIVSYDLLHNLDDTAQMHGTAVTSIAVGENVGVAPGAEVYYIASTFGNYLETGAEEDLNYMAESIRRVMEINECLTEDNKIRVISISAGFSENEKGYESVIKAIEEAKEEGIFVITCSTEINYGFSIFGLGRDIYENPDKVESYVPGILQQDWMEQNGSNAIDTIHTLMVPMDSRTYAFCTGTETYTFQRQGGKSLTVPWLAGVYALCLQVKPNMTETEFIEAAFQTGDTVSLSYNGKIYKFGTIINPKKLIYSLQEK